MRRTRKQGHRPGEYLMKCDLSGFTGWSSGMVKTWDGLWVLKEFHETRHPQDFVRGRAEDQSVPVSRPEPEAIFINACNADGRNGIAGYGTAGCSITGLSLPR